MIGDPNNSRRIALREQERISEMKRLRLMNYVSNRREADRLRKLNGKARP